MNTETGNIEVIDYIKRLNAEKRKKYIPMTVPPTPIQLKNKRVGRNDPCPCGSGKKFKKCHLRKV